MKKDDVLQLVGKKVGRLTIVEVIQATSDRKRAKYTLKCACQCGNICYHKVGDVVGAYPRFSCGCLRKEKWRKGYYAWLKEQEGII